MRTVPYHILLIGLLSCLSAVAQETPGNSWLQLNPTLSNRATGSGQATGQIGTLYVQNKGEEAIPIQAQQFFIPSSGSHQGYLARIPAGLTAAANTTTEVPIIGYCMNVDLPATPMGASLPSADQWHPVQQLNNPSESGAVAVLPMSPELTPFQAPKIESIKADNAYRRLKKTGDWRLQYPGTQTLIEGTLQLDQVPQIAAPLLQAILQSLQERYDQLAAQDLIRTPISGDALHERETIIQHAMWIISAKLRGQDYTYEDFANLTTKALQESSITTEGSQQDAATKTLWATFHRLIYQAGLSQQLPTEVAQFPTLINMPNWERLDLTAAFRKPGLLLTTSKVAAEPKRRGLWLPIIGGVVAGSGITYFLLDNDGESPPTDTMVIDPPPPPMIDSIRLFDDAYTLACLPPATVFPLQNDQGTQLSITNIGAAGGAQVTLSGTDALVISDFGGQSNFSFNITVTDSIGMSAMSTVNIIVDIPFISAVDDNYNTDYATPFTANVLTNDLGESLNVIAFDPPTTGANVNLQADGSLSVSPSSDFTGTLSFEYIIQDDCLQLDTAQITVVVGPPDCTFSGDINSTPTDCGLSNGTLAALVSPDGTYSYEWSNGDTTTNITMLEAGSYSLTVSSNSGLCQQTFDASVSENPIDYIGSLDSSPGDCTGGGQIILDLNAPGSEDLTVEWTGPGGPNSTTVPQGQTNLGELFNLFPGSYNLTIYPVAAGDSCSESATIVIADNTLSLLALPDQFSTPFETPVSGDVMLNDAGLSIELTANTLPTVGTLDINPNGQFSYIPPNDYTGTVSFGYTITDACGSSTMTTVTIEIGGPNCDITLSLSFTDSDCGLDNGSLTSTVLPAGEYSYMWSTGSTDSQLTDLSPGTYSLTVSSEGGLCEESMNATISENPTNYIISNNISAGNCLGGGNIVLELQSPEDLPLSIEVTTNGQTNTFEVSPGTVELANLMNITSGNYVLNIYPTAAGVDCSQLQGLSVPDNTPTLLTMGEAYSTEFQTPINGNVLANDSGLNIQLGGISNLVGGVIDFQNDGGFFFVPFNDFTGTASFDYIVTDACGNSSSASVTIEVGEPDCDWNVNFNTTSAACGLSTGTITTTVTPDDEYTYMWSTGASTPDINQLAAGEYLLTITSNSGVCNEIFSAIVGEEDPDYFVSSSTSPATCIGGGNITLELSSPDNSDFGGVISGPSLNQTLNLSPGINQFNEEFNLLPGSYTITVYSLTAGFQCTESIDLVIGDNTPPLAPLDDAYNTAYETPITENFLNNDSGLQLSALSVSAVNNGTLDFDTDGTFTFTPDDGFAGITGFTYVVSDACGQMSSVDVIITVSPPNCDFSLELLVANAVCDQPNGMITAQVTPDGIYTYAWSNGGTGSSISNLNTGSYSLTVTDQTGFCTQQAQASIVNGPPVFIDSLSTAPGNCAGDGSIIIEAYAPGNGTLDVLINGPNGSDLITINSGFSNLGDLVNLPSGVYDLVVYPTAVGLSCSEETFAIVEDNSPPFIVNDEQYFTPFQTPLVENVLLNDEGLLLEVTGVDNIVGGTVLMGTNGDFVFTPNNGGTGTASFTYTVMDACTDQLQGMVVIEIGPDNCNFDLSLSSTNSSCGFSDGEMTAIATPAGDYSYTWSTGATTETASGLFPGVYSVTVIDNVDGCPLSLQDTIFENVTDYFSGLQITPANCNEGAQVEFMLNNGYPGLYTLTVDAPSGGQQTLDNVPPGPVVLHDLITIESGSYTLSVYNQNIGQTCTDTLIAVVPDPIPSPMIDLSNIMLPSGGSSMDGSFDVVFTGLSIGPYMITINGQVEGQSDGSTFPWTGLNPGDYEVFATDANGCTSNIVTVTLTSTTAMRAGWSQTSFSFPLGQIEGPPSFLHVIGAPFMEIDFRRPRGLYRLRLQEWRGIDNTQPANRALLLGLQYVYSISPMLDKSEAPKRNQWSWANGLAFLQYDQGAWYWHSTLSWQPKFVDNAKLVTQLYVGDNNNLQIGLQWQW